MKFEEKIKKNKNCEISQIVRPEVTPEVYNQKQKTLFISECVEHRRFKFEQDCGCIRTDTRTSARVYAPPRVFGCMHVPTVRDDGSDGRAALRFVSTSRTGARRGYSWRSARIFLLHDSDGRTARFGRGARLGRDASTVRPRRIRAKLYGHDRAMWLVFRNVHMQLKVNACN